MTRGVYPRNKNKLYGMTGKHHTEESKQKNREKKLGKEPWNKGKHYHFKQKRKSGNKYWLGKHRYQETKDKLSEIGKTKTGEKASNWQGGISFEPYCLKFNKKLKRQIRERDNYQCQHPECLCTQLESKILYGQSLHVHHIHYDKPNCNPDLITLCLKHNTIANGNRDYHEELFMNILKERNLIKL